MFCFQLHCCQYFWEKLENNSPKGNCICSWRLLISAGPWGTILKKEYHSWNNVEDYFFFARWKQRGRFFGAMLLCLIQVQRASYFLSLFRQAQTQQAYLNRLHQKNERTLCLYSGTRLSILIVRCKPWTKLSCMLARVSELTCSHPAVCLFCCIMPQPVSHNPSSPDVCQFTPLSCDLRSMASQGIFAFVHIHRYEYTTCQHISWQR